MTRRQKNVLIFIGLAILMVAFILITYALWPLPGVVEEVPLAPEIFAPP